jgi:hypothetical protein
MTKSQNKIKKARKSRPVGRPSGITPKRATRKTSTRSKAKHIGTTSKRQPYQKGKTALKIAYNGVDNVFALDLVAVNTGKKIGEFHVSGTTFSGVMGMPIMLTQS